MIGIIAGVGSSHRSMTAKKGDVVRRVVEFLKNSDVQYLATIGVEGRPKVRPFQFMLENGGRLYFCTSNEKNVFRELIDRPELELCVSGEGHSWLRLSGRAVFADDAVIKRKILQVSPLVEAIYGGPDNEALQVFYLHDPIATISDLGGNQPLVIKG